MAHLDRDRLAATARAQGQPPRVADGDDRDHGVLAPAAAEGVAVPRDAVATVAVVAAAGRHERLAQLGVVVLGEPVPRLGEGRVGERFADAVRVHEPGYVDHPVVHLPALGSPRHVAHHGREHLVGVRQPVAEYVDPRAPGQPPALEPVEGPARPRRPVSKRVPWKSTRPVYARIEQVFDDGLGDGSGVRQGQRAAIPCGTRSVVHVMLCAHDGHDSAQRHWLRRPRPQPDQDLRHRPGPGPGARRRHARPRRGASSPR